MKNRKIKIILGYLIGIIPTNALRVFFYRTLFGYRISGASIGWRTIIVVEDAEINGCHIGRNNLFIGPMKIKIKKGAKIVKGNKFICGWWTIEERFKPSNFDRKLEVGMNTLITSEHYFDVAGSFTLGDKSWIAGYGSQFWTHGAHVRERNINIGEHSYIGTAVRFAPGASVGNNCIVSLGSVLTRGFQDENAVIAGQPAKIVKENYDWKTRTSID